MEHLTQAENEEWLADFRRLRTHSEKAAGDLVRMLEERLRPIAPAVMIHNRD